MLISIQALIVMADSTWVGKARLAVKCFLWRKYSRNKRTYGRTLLVVG